MGIFDPKWKGKNIRKVIRAIGTIEDQDTLYELARGIGLNPVLTQAEEKEAREAAINQITDIVYLMDLYTKDSHSYSAAGERMRSLELDGQDLPGIIRFNRKVWSTRNMNFDLSDRSIEQMRQKAVDALDDTGQLLSLIEEIDPAGEDFRIMAALLARAGDAELVKRKYARMRESRIIEARELAAKALGSGSEADRQGDRMMHFQKLVRLMYGEEARHDREVGYGYARTALPPDIKRSVEIIAEDRDLLMDLREELISSNSVRNWDNSWRYHGPILREIDRLAEEL